MSNLDQKITVSIYLKDNNTLRIGIQQFNGRLQNFILMSVKPELLKLMGQHISKELLITIEGIIRERIYSLINSGYLVDMGFPHGWRLVGGMEKYLKEPDLNWKDETWKEKYE